MEKPIVDVATRFLNVIRSINTHKEGCDLSVSLSVTTNKYQNGTPKVKLEAHFWDGDTHHNVRAASLGALLYEIKDRLDFADLEASRIDAVEASLTALPAPSEESI